MVLHLSPNQHGPTASTSASSLSSEFLTTAARLQREGDAAFILVLFHSFCCFFFLCEHGAVVVYMMPAVEGSKDEVELPRRKRVKEERDAEEVSTVTSGKVVVSATGSARIVVSAAAERTPAPYKLTAKTRMKRSASKKDIAVRKNKSSSVKSTNNRRTAGKKLKKTTQKDGKRLTERRQHKVTQRQTSNSVKRTMSQQQQQPSKKKQRLV